MRASGGMQTGEGAPRTEVYWRRDIRQQLLCVARAVARAADAMPGAQGHGYRQGFSDALFAIAEAFDVDLSDCREIVTTRRWGP